jgi:putative heme-binding domain-containing protein
LKARPDLARGAQIFTQQCAVCHSIDRQGGNLGPQLDGVGHRGLERICEDILDPNRNVDLAFRYSVVTLKSGEIISGLFRREEGDLLVFADPTGKEITVQKSAIQERQESNTSLMPEVFGDLLPPGDFHHLLAFLLSKSAKPNPP